MSFVAGGSAEQAEGAVSFDNSIAAMAGSSSQVHPASPTLRRGKWALLRPQASGLRNSLAFVLDTRNQARGARRNS